MTENRGKGNSAKGKEEQKPVTTFGICTHTYTVARASVTHARTHDPMLLSKQGFFFSFAFAESCYLWYFLLLLLLICKKKKKKGCIDVAVLRGTQVH